MRKPLVLILTAAVTLTGIGWSTLYGAPVVTKEAKATAAAAKPKDIGGPMPLPVAQTIDKENKPSDKLHVEVTNSVLEGTQYVAYVKIVWGDLDNVIKKDGAQFYSDWDGSLTLVSATGAIDKKIQFDDGTGKGAATKPAKLPGPGSGRDEVLDKSGAVIEWKSGVVGALDGLRIKITSPTPTIHGTLVAGKFTIPITINGATVTPPKTPPTYVAPALPKSRS